MAYSKPTSATFNGYQGFYSGASITVKGSSSYPYLYIADTSKSYTYYLKTSSFSGSYTLTLNTDTSYTSSYKSMQIILSNTNLGSSCTVGNEHSSYVYFLQVPRFAARIYNASSSYSTYRSDTHNLTIDLLKGDYGILGFTTSSTSRTATYSIEDSPDGNGWQSGMDGKTLYTIHYKAASSSSSTCYYYRGSNSKKSVSVTTTTSAAYLYGKGTTYGGTTSSSVGSMTTTCLSNSSYSLQGWSTSSSSKTVSYSDAADAFADGYTTIYGVYYKASSSSNNTVYYYRGSSTKNSVTETATTSAGYYYGTGSKSGGTTSYSYGTINTSCAGDSSYSLVGWTGSSTSTTASYSSAESAFASYNTIYGIYKKSASTSSSTCYYYRGNSTKNSVTKTTTVSDAYLYGTGSSSGGTSSTSYGTIDTSCAVSGWTFIGFSSSSSTQSSSSSATTLFNNGYTTIYGTYSKTESMTYYPENGNSSSSVSVTNYLYGTGSTTSNVPTEPSLTRDNYTQIGWATQSESSDVSTWAVLWNDGTRTVYAIWKENIKPMYVGINGTPHRVTSIYIGVNGVPKNVTIGYSSISGVIKQIW